ncbi:MAG: 2-C-methyl-D-erythritol 2,4-cyclodiphosphate synthase [Pirellulales bacterium]|jgi:2-C-methyl-D-erythritol 2,4-cyclodiphosphate synthase
MFRIGLGHDTHRLTQGGPLRLGGTDVPHSKHAEGHSDADVLMHAITDALLGAANLPDIGQLFPNTDEVNKDRDSAVFLQEACSQVQQAGWKLANLDCVIAAQKPKLSPFKEAMRTRLAEIMQVNPSQIGIKAKTGEHVGPIGREESIDVHCVALLEKINQ